MSVKKILFFKPGAIGDFLQTLPSLKSLRSKFPDARVTAVVSPGLEVLIQGTDIADSVILFDKPLFKKDARAFLLFGMRLRREGYALFVDMQPSFRSLVLRRIAAAKRTLIYRKQKKIKKGERRMHAVENFMATLSPLGIKGRIDDIELPVKGDAAAAVDRFLKEAGIAGSRPLVALNCSVGAARPARNWFPERFSKLADRIAGELRADVLFVGGREDSELVDSVIRAMKHRAVSAAGRLDLPESAALLGRSACLVSSDTGPLHLATAVGTHVVGLYGSTDPARTGPVGKGHSVLMSRLPCAPCEDKECRFGTRECMAAITVEDALECVKKAMRGR